MRKTNLPLTPFGVATTEPECIQRLQKLGYEEGEARFLSIVALHSGYFLRRQFLRFTGGTKGWKDIALLERLKANGHARALVFRHERMVYHLSSKSIYEALGDPNNRNRREHQPATIKNKIMALDFILDHPVAEFLATEREKIDYFVETRKITREDLPTKFYASPYGGATTAKHFVERYPMFVTSIHGRVITHFCYIDEGLQTTDRFATFLAHYRRLLRALGDFRVQYVAEDERLFASAGRVFDKLLQTISASPALNQSETERLLAYFRKRRSYEERDFSEFDTAGLICFREEKTHFAGEPYDTLFSDWKARELADSTNENGPHSDISDARARRLTTYILNYDYDLFGTLAGKNHKRRNGGIPTELLQPVGPITETGTPELHKTEAEMPKQDHTGRR
jgi:hypothetical protein